VHTEMNIVYTLLLALGAFLLGAVPFSVIVGRKLLAKDITRYGDGNPGATNVFRAGSVKAGLLAVFLDVAKGVPFIVLAYTPLHLPPASFAITGISAVMGHAFSPCLRWRGGKAISVTFGVLVALPERRIFLVFLIFMLIGFLILDTDSWIPILSSAGTSLFLILKDGPSWGLLLMLCILGIFIVKHYESLRILPRLNSRVLRWVKDR
jgi:acyl phosphate:glycerol-3-phosphate acyltransferase